MEVFKALSNRCKKLLATAFLIIPVTLFYLPLLRNLKTTVPALDWYGIYAFPSFFRLSVLQYHQFPLWAPHFGGGYPLIGHPYDISLNFLSVIVLFFGAIAGTKITVFFIFLMSAVSVFYLTRHILKYNFLGALFSSLTFAFSSWGGCVYLDSNYEKLYIYFLPLILVFFIKTIKNRKFIFLTCLALSQVVLCSGTMLIPVTLFIFLFACLHTMRVESWGRVNFDLRYLRIFLLAISITFLLCMVKILPMHNLLSRSDIKPMHFSQEHNYAQVSKHIIKEERALNLHKLFAMLFIKDSYIVGIHGVAGDDHLQFNLGYLPVILAILAFMLYWRKNFRYLILLIIFVLLSFGPYSKVDLFKWLWQLNPVVHNIWRLDEFFTFPILLIISVVAGSFFSLFDKSRSRILLALLMLAAIFSLNNMFWANRRFLYNQNLKEVPKKMVSVVDIEERDNPVFQKKFYQVKIKDPLADPEHYQKDGYFYLQQNVGMVNWLFTNLEINSAAIPKFYVKPGDYKYILSAPGKLEFNPIYRGEVFFLDENNHARIQYFSPNEIIVDVELKNLDTLIINQNYYPGWRADKGSLSNRNGLLALTLDKTGSYKVRLTYVPLDFYLGLIISIITLLFLCYYLLI